MFVLFLLAFSGINLLYSQNTLVNENGFFEHVRFGGSIGLAFGNDYFSANLAPKAIYDFNRNLSAGVGALMAYANGSNYSDFVVGGSVIGMYRPWPVVRFSAEFEELHVSEELEFIGGDINREYWYPALFLGVGYNVGPVTVGVRYDVLYEEGKSIYGNAFMPFVSVYF